MAANWRDDMAQRNLNAWTADQGYGLLLVVGTLLLVAGASLSAAGRDGSAPVWMGGILVALAVFGPRIESFRLPGGSGLTLRPPDVVQSTLDALGSALARERWDPKAGVTPRPAITFGGTLDGLRASSEPAQPPLSPLSVPATGAYWSEDVLKQAVVAASSNGLSQLGQGLAELMRVAQRPNSIRFGAEDAPGSGGSAETVNPDDR